MVYHILLVLFLILWSISVLRGCIFCLKRCQSVIPSIIVFTIWALLGAFAPFILILESLDHFFNLHPEGKARWERLGILVSLIVWFVPIFIQANRLYSRDFTKKK
jgi:hypothetical protein